jgi:small GTP-binding protein
MSNYESEKEEKKNIKVAILGGGAVGKTSVTYKCLKKEIESDEIDTTLEDHYKLFLEIFGEIIEVEIIDTAGQEDYQNFFDTWVNYAEGFILIFSINDKNSYNVVQSKYNKIIARKGNNIHIILVGNKKDLVNEREVNDIDVKKFAKEKKINYIETSAITGENCQETFYEISKLVYIQKYNVKNIYDEIRIKKCCCNII